MVPLLFGALFASSFISTFSQVRYGRSISGTSDAAVYSVITCAIATVFFYAMAGFAPAIDQTVLTYALLYMFVVIVAQYVGIVIYKYMDVLESGMIRSGGGLICTFFAGAAVFRERIGWIDVIRMLLSVSAILSLHIHKGNRDKKTFGRKRDPRAKNAVMGYLLCGISMISSTFGTILNKNFSQENADRNAYFMLVNIFALVFSIFFCVCSTRGNIKVCVGELKAIECKGYLYILFSTIGSNVGSLLNIAILAVGVPVVLITPLSTAIGVLVQVAVAKLAAKETIPPVPVLLSLASAMLLFVK